MFRASALGRTKEEALSKLDAIMMRNHPDEPFSRSMVKVSEYGDEKSDEKYIAEYTPFGNSLRF